MEEYLKTYVLGVKEDTTYDKYYGCYRLHIKGSKLGQMKLNLITEEDMLDYFKERIEKGYAKSTIKTIHTILNRAFIRAKKKKYMEENPLEEMEIPYKKCVRQDTEKEILSYDDKKNWKEASRNPGIVKNILYTALYSQ